MKTTRWLIVLATTVGLLVAGVLAVMVSSPPIEASRGFSIRTGLLVSRESFDSVSRHRLAALGDSSIFLIGRHGDRAYYITRRSGQGACYASGELLQLQLLDVVCTRTDELQTAVIDMSGVVIDTKTGLILRLAQVEGIAANEVNRVGIEVGGQLVATTPVQSNVYRFAKNDLPASAEAIVALDASGKMLWRKPVAIPPPRDLLEE